MTYEEFRNLVVIWLEFAQSSFSADIDFADHLKWQLSSDEAKPHRERLGIEFHIGRYGGVE